MAGYPTLRVRSGLATSEQLEPLGRMAELIDPEKLLGAAWE